MEPLMRHCCDSWKPIYGVNLWASTGTNYGRYVRRIPPHMMVFFFLLEDVEDWAFDASLLRPWEAHVWGQLLVASQRMGGMSGVFPHTLLRLAPSYHQHQFRICPLLRDFEGHHFRSNSSAVCVVIAGKQRVDIQEGETHRRGWWRRQHSWVLPSDWLPNKWSPQGARRPSLTVRFSDHQWLEVNRRGVS